MIDRAKNDDPILLTPGPLTTSMGVKRTMLTDWGSWDREFIGLTTEMRRKLVAICGGSKPLTAIPVQGSGTFAVEAMLTTFVPRDGKVLMLTNGAYGGRAVSICRQAGIPHTVMETDEITPPAPADVDARLRDDPSITHVFLVHCETTTGILNPLEPIAEIVAAQGRRLLIDAMSSFGAIPIDADATQFDALASSANKCLQGVPGFGFVLAAPGAIQAAEGNSTSLSLDLYPQWKEFENSGKWRFTPPTHVVAALNEALDEHQREGGVPARYSRYRSNCDTLVGGLRKLGFQPLLPDAIQAPIIVTFYAPTDPAYSFQAFYDCLAARGFLIYPGKLTAAETFRIGCIGALDSSDMQNVVNAVAATLKEMDVDPSRDRKKDGAAA